MNSALDLIIIKGGFSWRKERVQEELVQEELLQAEKKVGDK